MNHPDREGIVDALGNIERAGAGIYALGELLTTAEKDFFHENTLSGIGYLLQAIGDRITVSACAGRDALYGRTASATPPGEAAAP